MINWTRTLRAMFSSSASSTWAAILVCMAAAVLLEGRIATAQSPGGNGVTISPVPMIHVVRPGGVPARGAVTRLPAQDSAPALGGALPLSAGLKINPIFDSTITSDPNAAAIESAINTAIANIQSQLSDPITVNINFAKINTGLGQSSTFFGSVAYSTFLAALKGDAKTSDDATAIALLPNLAADPVTGHTTINVKTANFRAVGINVNPPAGQPDGFIQVNTSITSPGSPGSSLTYNLIPVVEHEIDEVLGLGSSLPNVPSGLIFPEDLFRYSATHTRTFTTANSLAFFSIDGSTAPAQFDNQNDGGDFGDWQSSPLPSGVQPKVQDAFATPGSNPTLSVEFTALDVIGYDHVVAIQPSVSITANGQVGPLTLAPGASLQLVIAANGGTTGFANPSTLYIGVSTPFGLLWLASTGFTSTTTPFFSGPLPSFGPAPLLTIANVSTLPPGTYTWFIGVVNGTSGFVLDTVQTTVP